MGRYGANTKFKSQIISEVFVGKKSKFHNEEDFLWHMYKSYRHEITWKDFFNKLHKHVRMYIIRFNNTNTDKGGYIMSTSEKPGSFESYGVELRHLS